MERHVKLFRWVYPNDKPSNALEIDYCKTANAAVIRCKTGFHLTRAALQEAIEALEHVRDHHMQGDSDADPGREA